MIHSTQLLALATTLTTIGADIGDRYSFLCILDAAGEVVGRGRFRTTPGQIRKVFGSLERGRVAIEACTHSAWICELLEELGFEVIVANPRQMLQVGGKRRRKNDRIDAEMLARIARLDSRLLRPIRHRGPAARRDLAIIRARDGLVSCRTKLINTVRGLVKYAGARLVGCSAESFHKRAAEAISKELHPALMPLITSVEELTKNIRAYDRQIDELAESRYPETKYLTQVSGVGNLTSMTYVLTLEDPSRFARSRAVGPYLGLVPRQHQSGDEDPELRISKHGDVLLRRLLVTSAQYILGPLNRQDSDLRRFGLAIASTGKKNAKKRAVVAVARKLAVLLHALWRSTEVYEPLRASESATAMAS